MEMESRLGAVQDGQVDTPAVPVADGQIASAPAAAAAEHYPTMVGREPQPFKVQEGVPTVGEAEVAASLPVETDGVSSAPKSFSSGQAAQMDDASASSLPLHGSPGLEHMEITEQLTPKIASSPGADAQISSLDGAPAASRQPEALASPLDVTAVLPAATAAAEETAAMASAKSLLDMTGPDARVAVLAPAEGTSPAMPAVKESLSLKDLPKVAVDAAKQATDAYVEAGKEAGGIVSKLVAAVWKPGPVTFTVDQVATVLFLGVVGFQLLLIPVFMPSLFRLLSSVVWGLLFGLGLSFLFYYNKKRKAETNELLSINLGLKSLPLVAGGLPSWLNVSQNERLEWLNALIVEVWPYVDKGVCEMIKEITTQGMPGVLATLPAGLSGIVKSIAFKHLTFGDAPFRVESMWVSPDEKESLVMELSVKWTGDPNITLAIEIPGGQKLCPRVMDITFIATMRIKLHPLVARVPGFVAAMATVPKPPLIKYRLDFGKALGGSMAPAAVTPVVNYFMREIITKMMVWPQRMVIPILQSTEQDRVEIQKLMRRHRGVLRICVVAAKELKAQDWGANDVQVELTTDSEHYESTSIRRARPIQSESKEEQERLGESVTWNDYIFLLIQEPKDQLLRLEAFDVDRIRPSKLLTGQVTQIVNSRALVGRSLVKLADACREGTQAQGQPEPHAVMTHLGKGEWGTPGGPGKGHGKVRLSMTYWPFERFTKYDVENAMTGIVTVRLLRVWGLATAGDSLSAFVRVTSSANRKEWRSRVQTWTRRAHVNRLKAERKRLEVARERDLREGRTREAKVKAKFLEALDKAIRNNTDKRNKQSNNNTNNNTNNNSDNSDSDTKEHDEKVNNARLVVDMDFSLDSNAMHAIYHVKLTDVIKIKVLESSLLASNECLGRLDIPVSDIITANDFNPMTGQREFGLHRKRWEDYDPAHPDRSMDDLERGILLEEGDGARMWVELRWVPCIQARGPQPEDGQWSGAANANGTVDGSQAGDN